MRIALVGKSGSITHWLEDAAAAWRGDGHQLYLAYSRRPWIAKSLESAVIRPLVSSQRAAIRRFRPQLIVAIGAYHVPLPLLEAIASLPGRPPLAGWVGDVFEPADAVKAGLYDLVGYADSALVERHQAWGFAADAIYLPHAVNPRAAPAPAGFGKRSARMVFVANPTPLRREVVSKIAEPITVFGPGWRPSDGPAHDIRARRVSARRVPAIYGAHRAALNIRNERNVVAGLNQRNFTPCLAGATLLTDDQPDLERCFEPGREVLVWRDAGELNGLHGRVLGDADFAAGVAEAGRARVLAHHTFAHRLATLAGALGLSPS